MKQRSTQLGFMEITNYYYEHPNGDVRRGGDPGIARNAYGLLGTERLAASETGPLGGSVLMEIGGLNSRSQKSVGMLRNNVREMLEAVLVATADGSLTATTQQRPIAFCHPDRRARSRSTIPTNSAE